MTDPRVAYARAGVDVAAGERAGELGCVSIRGVLAALDLPYDRFCFACFDGRYPEPVPYDAMSRKFMLEEPVPARG
mgnify:CR=1 FL=1